MAQRVEGVLTESEMSFSAEDGVEEVCETDREARRRDVEGGRVESRGDARRPVVEARALSTQRVGRLKIIVVKGRG